MKKSDTSESNSWPGHSKILVQEVFDLFEAFVEGGYMGPLIAKVRAASEA